MVVPLSVPRDEDISNGGPDMSVKSLDQVVEETVAEAMEALEDPYRFAHPIKRVAIIGAGPSGVKCSFLRLVFCSLTHSSMTVGCRQVPLTTRI
jgi:hypothetical protein